MTVPETSQQAPLPVRTMLWLERERSLDRAVAALRPFAEAVAGDGTRRRLLEGQPVGHALHPVLSDVPLGAWLSAAVLDLTGGRQARPAATRLLGLGILTAVPTAVTGWVEWAGADEEQRRVGVVHAGSNNVALGLYTASWFARRRNRHGLGLALSFGAGGCAAAGGFLGSHMSLARKVSSRHPAFDPGRTGQWSPGAGTSAAASTRDKVT